MSVITDRVIPDITTDIIMVGQAISEFPIIVGAITTIATTMMTPPLAEPSPIMARPTQAAMLLPA
jgi:hypothetical protein